NALELEQAGFVQLAVSKTSRLYKNGQWDLVDAMEADENAQEQMDTAALPAPLQGKSTPENKAYAAQKRREREAIPEAIRDRNVKREAYLAKNQEGGKGELENAMMAAIKAQAATKNYIWR